MKIHAFALLSMLTYSVAHGNEIILQTGDTQNTIIELYTSEGCNSCPPAEHLLNTYKEKTNTWHNIIPIAFHVDYWDYLGWKDKFAQAAFGTRQRHYAQIQRRTTVYTPAFFVNGKNWRPGFFYKGLPEQSHEKVGKLKVRINQHKLQAFFEPVTSITQPLHLNIALLGMGLKTQIKAGENKGRLSHHEFVVLHHQQHTSKNKRWSISLPQRTNIKAPQYALAAWISTESNPTPIQATGTYLPSGFIK